jgi:anionic cell wall polymer biosynthesis LytR-Cps2A-Psr (LCP) family protein
MNYYISVDFVGFQRAMGENLKTLDVDVHETLDDPWYPITGKELDTCGLTGDEINELMTKYSGFELEKQFPCRYEHLHFSPGLTKMQAGIALKYVRSRHGSSDGDISRGRRAQEVIIAIGKKLLFQGALDTIPKYYQLFTKNVQTDISLETAEYIGPFIKSAKDFKVVDINLSTTNVVTLSTAGSQSIVAPKAGMFNWEEIKSFVSSQIESAK